MLFLVGIAMLIGLALMLVTRVLRPQGSPVTDAIDQLLPQTQCGQCGYPGCRPYAEAVFRGDAKINRCPPGGEITIRELAKLLGRAPLPLDPQFGSTKPREIALIDESACIGCKKCILACPVDAIIGARKMMHTVIAQECTGCTLCVPVCPVDCIAMEPAVSGLRAWKRPRPRREPEARLDQLS